MSLLRTLFLSLLLTACGGGGCGGSSSQENSNLITIPGTTNRITETPTVKEGTDLFMKIFTRTEECDFVGTTPEEKEACMPHVDRASGEVRLGFQLRLRNSSDPFPLPLSSEHVRALHDNVHIKNGPAHTGFTLVPHRPISAKQLFIVVIDGSQSMREVNGSGVSRIDQVRRALLSNGVKDAFFPGDVRTGVLMLQFTQGAPVPLTGQLAVLENKADYATAIENHLQVRGGYTHLYSAVQYATQDLLEQDMVRRWLEINDAEPTVIVLTDGFNNTRRDERCQDNAEQLNRLLKHLQKIRRDATARTPRVFTVGLGRPLRRNYRLPNQRGTEVSGQELCGRFAAYPIDGQLENIGIDNASLEWIAAYGGGSAYVRQGSRKLGEAFAAAAAKRYLWFEARYRVHPVHLRRQFVAAIELLSFATARAEVTIHPSAWLDAPPGVTMADGWTRPASYRSTLTVVFPLMGGILVMMYFGAASFNSRRVILGRMRPPRPPRDSEG